MKKTFISETIINKEVTGLTDPFYKYILDGINRDLQEDGYQPVALCDCAFYFERREEPKFNNYKSDKLQILVEFTAEKQH